MGMKRGALAQLIVFIALMVAAAVSVGIIITTTSKAATEAKKARIVIPAEAMEIAGTKTLGILADDDKPTLVALADAIKKYYDQQLENPSFAVQIRTFDELAEKDAAVIIGWFDREPYTTDTLVMYIAGDMITNKKILWLLPHGTNYNPDASNNYGIDNTFALSIDESNPGKIAEARKNSTLVKKLTSKVTASAIFEGKSLDMDVTNADNTLKNSLAYDHPVIIYTAPSDLTNTHPGIIEVRLANGNTIFFVIVGENVISDFIKGESTARAKALGQLLINFPTLLA